MKIREREHVAQGMGGGFWCVRVVEVKKGGEVPAGAVEVPDDTPVTDWQRDENQEV